MKKFVLSCAAALISFAAAGADTAAISGAWQVHISISGTERDQSCTFTQTGSDLAGSCSTDEGTAKLTGKVDGNKVTFSYKSEYQGTPLTVNYEGKLDSASKMSGTVSVPEFGADGDFTATQSTGSK